jgi:hypothetical protein
MTLYIAQAYKFFHGKSEVNSLKLGAIPTNVINGFHLNLAI